ncbi:MAG: hypothetical protein HFJ30_08220 [Clostridia bacterium]|jgi:colanic acid/amylovoran biosynthesis protein|nr:hypothetical protein [Clostridia bacterium]
MGKIQIFILAYARQNLGDDLFIYMLLKKYSKISFVINIENSEHAKAFEKFSNVTIVHEKERKLMRENARQYSAYIYIGGSIFMEGGTVYNISEVFLDFLKECNKSHIPFYYVSSNFGPAYTREYIELARKVYKNCTDICFRDLYSYHLFEEIPTVRYAPDLAFSYQLDEIIAKRKGTVGVSMIDLAIRKDLIQQEENYYRMLTYNILQYIKESKQVYLFSFCKHEGDENAIQKLMKRIPEEYKTFIHCVNYNGDIELFLKNYASMEYMICARFHAMVLSSILGQKCRVISYSNKIDNVVQDLQLFHQKIIHIKELNEETKIPLKEFEEVLPQKREAIAKEAEKQLEKIKELMKSLGE